MSFLTTISPKGGKRLSTIWAGIRGEKNMIFHPDKRPVEVSDYFALRIGYATEDIKKGQMIYIKKSEGQYLKKFFDMFF